MAESPSRPDTDPGIPPHMPRWVKVAAIVAAALVLLFVVLQLTGIGGQHGPGRHISGLGVGEMSDDAPATLSTR